MANTAMPMKTAYLGPKQSAMICSDSVYCDMTLLTFNHGPADFDNLYPIIREALIETNNLDLGEGVCKWYLEKLINGGVISYDGETYDVKSSLAGRLIYRSRRFSKVIYKLSTFYDSLFNTLSDISSNI